MLAFGIALFVLVLAVTGAGRIGAIVDADPAWIGVAFLLGFGVTIVSTFRWGYVTNCLTGRETLRWPQYWAALMTSRVLGLVVPRTASDLGVRFVTLTGVGRTTPEVAAASVALDQLFDMALLLAALVPSLLLLGGAGLWAVAFGAVAVTTSVVAMLHLGRAVQWFSGVLATLATRLGNRGGGVGAFFRRRSESLVRLSRVEHFTTRQATILAAATLARYALNAAMFWSLAEALELPISLWTFVLAGAGVQLSLVAAITPGGLGIMDLGWVGLLTLGGASSEAVGLFIVGQRAFQYTFFPVMAGLSYVTVLRRGDRAVAEEPSEETAPG